MTALQALPGNPNRDRASSAPVRTIVHRTHGSTHGPITRLVSPTDLGGLLKPFVFLDLNSFGAGVGSQGFAMHPHSGIATLTFLMTGNLRYEDTTGKKGVLLAGGVEWMRSGNGVWHIGAPVGDLRMSGFQLWVALPPSEENAHAESLYLAPSDVPHDGPARVLLGSYGNARSPIPAPWGMNYLAVGLKDSERWRYVPPAGHTVAWLAVSSGRLEVNGMVGTGELAVFEESEQAIECVAHGDTSFVLGSAVKHPHDLVMGYYSVHTSKAALAQGEAEIERIGDELRRNKRIT